MEFEEIGKLEHRLFDARIENSWRGTGVFKAIEGGRTLGVIVTGMYSNDVDFEDVSVFYFDDQHAVLTRNENRTLCLESQRVKAEFDRWIADYSGEPAAQIANDD